MSEKQMSDLVARLRFAPTLTMVDPETFQIPRQDLAILLGARTDAAAFIESLFPAPEED